MAKAGTGLKVAGIVLMLAGIAGCVLGFGRHQDASENQAQIETRLKEIQELGKAEKAGGAAAAEARERAETLSTYIRGDTDLLSKQLGERNMMGGGGAALLLVGLALLAVGISKGKKA